MCGGKEKWTGNWGSTRGYGGIRTVIYILLWEMSTSSYERNFLRCFLKLIFFYLPEVKILERDMTLQEAVVEILIGV